MILSTQCNYITQNEKIHDVGIKLLYCGNKKKELVADGISRIDMAIMFYLLKNLVGGSFTKVSEPADPNRNCSSIKWASFPFTRFFCRVWWRNSEIRLNFQKFSTFSTTTHQPPTTDDNNYES